MQRSSSGSVHLRGLTVAVYLASLALPALLEVRKAVGCRLNPFRYSLKLNSILLVVWMHSGAFTVDYADFCLNTEKPLKSIDVFPKPIDPTRITIF